MYAIMIPLQDLYYAAKNSKRQVELRFNFQLFTPELLALFDNQQVDLFVLLDKPASAAAPQMLLAHDKMAVAFEWPMILEYLHADLDDWVEEMPPIVPSHDLMPIRYSFQPQEKAWQDPKYVERIMVTHITPAPDQALLEANKIVSLRLENSYIPIGRQLRVTNHVESLKENLRGRKAYIILDNDDTMLNNRASRLWYRTILNEPVLAMAKSLRETLIGYGAEVTCLSMSAREKQAERDPVRAGHPMSMDCIAEVVNKSWFPIVYDPALSFSYPVHIHPTKQTKIAHFGRLLMDQKISMQGGVVILFDDCEFELNLKLVAQAQEELRDKLQVELIVVPIKRFGLTPAAVVQGLLEPKQPTSATASPQRLFAPAPQPTVEEPNAALADAFEGISLS